VLIQCSTAVAAYQQLSNAGCQERNNINKSRVLSIVTHIQKNHVKISLQPVTTQYKARIVTNPLLLTRYI